MRSRFLLLSIPAFAAVVWLARDTDAPRRVEPALGDVSLLEDAYAEWKREFEAGPRIVEIGLGASKALTKDRGNEMGFARFDLDAHRVVIRVENATIPLDAWLVENVEAPGASVSPDAGDRIERLGTLVAHDAYAQLDVDLARHAAADLRPDLVLLTRVGGDPTRDARIVGQPGLFERLWSAERAARADTRRSGLLLASVTSAGLHTNFPFRSLIDLVAEGEDLFFNGTFSGNGRTCGTCHPAENNFTLDRDFIATMQPFDPLFVAEFDPNLMQDPVTGERFETPLLMHQFGLITINPDGFDDLANKFVLRAVSHTFAQQNSILRPFASSPLPRQRTGWAGDGAPGSGTLREFATGAVIQHFPKRMTRLEGADFRLPTDHELDALEAFMLTLGRRLEVDVNTLVFVDNAMSAGQSIFPICQSCHFQAGANGTLTQVGNQLVPVGNPSGFANGNFNTGVERFLGAHPDSTGVPRPLDGGFGVIPIDPFAGTQIGQPGPNQDGSFGDKTFNTQSLIEFADTVPAFHNHVTAHGPLGTDPVEAAVRFYTTQEFGVSPAGQLIFGGPILISDQQVKDIAALLRGINALDNIRESRGNLVRAGSLLSDANVLPDDPTLMRRLQIARADAVDGRDVLAGAGLSPLAIHDFNAAIQAIDQALNTGLFWTERWDGIVSALNRLKSARGKIVQ